MIDPIADFLARIRNAQMARQTEVFVPYSRLKEEIANVMKKNNFLKNVEVDKTEKFPRLHLELPEKILELKRVSKCGQRIYRPMEKIHKTCNGLGISILSTSKGVMTGYQARSLNVGGEVLCEIN